MTRAIIDGFVSDDPYMHKLKKPITYAYGADRYTMASTGQKGIIIETNRKPSEKPPISIRNAFHALTPLFAGRVVLTTIGDIREWIGPLDKCPKCGDYFRRHVRIYHSGEKVLCEYPHGSIPLQIGAGWLDGNLILSALEPLNKDLMVYVSMPERYGALYVARDEWIIAMAGLRQTGMPVKGGFRLRHEPADEVNPIATWAELRGRI